MSSRSSGSRRLLGGIALIAVGMAVGAGGLALAAGGGGAIHACATRRSGRLRLAAKCQKDERAVSWQMQGSQGPQGPKGDQGSIGPQGAPGSPGAPGSAAASIMTARTSASIGQEGYFAAGGPSTLSGTESEVTVLTPATTTVAEDLAVTDLRSSPDDNTRVYVLRVNGADTALTCSIVAGSHTCTDSVHTVTIPPDSQVAIHRALLTGTGGGADGTAVLAAWRATTP